MRYLSSPYLRGLFLVPILALYLNAQVSIIGELSQDKDALPGDVYTGTIVIRNDTNEPQEAKVYQTDYTFQFNGTNNYGEPGLLPRSNAKWIAFSPGRGYIDGLFVIRPDGTGMRRVADRGGWPVWFPDGRQLGYQNVARDGAGEHCAVPLTGGPARNLIPLRFTGMNNPFDISPDGAVLATTTSNALTSDIWLLSIPGHSPAQH